MSYVQLTACSADIQGSGDKFAYFIWLYGVMTVWPDHGLHGNNASCIVLRLDLWMLVEKRKVYVICTYTWCRIDLCHQDIST